MADNELFPIVDESGNVTGSASRQICHSGSMLLHPVVHLHVFSPTGAILLQKRSADKDIQPGKWDTSVGGHVDLGESVLDALMREATEELGASNFTPTPLVSYIFQSDMERELVNAFTTVLPEDYPFVFQRDEISEISFWSRADIDVNIGKGIFTPNFESEYQKFLK